MRAFSVLVPPVVAGVDSGRGEPAGRPAGCRLGQKSAQRALLDTYCVGCHNARTKAGDLLLDELDLTRLLENAPTGEKIVRKLRAGMMPPAGARRPDAKALGDFIASLEETLDRAEVKPPPPGLHRLNRTEYANVIRDLLGLEVDADEVVAAG